jgi:hypothetical protein
MVVEDEAASLPHEQAVSLTEAYAIACFSLPVLLIYAAAQTGISFLLGPEHADLKLVLEPNLLLLGLILHVQWRRVGTIFLAHDLRRPVWISAADLASFVITFWACWVLVEAFLREAQLL